MIVCLTCNQSPKARGRDYTIHGEKYANRYKEEDRLEVALLKKELTKKLAENVYLSSQTIKLEHKHKLLVASFISCR